MKLILEDGSEWSGAGFGALNSAEGEVVFNTGMTGYIETLTDPSYRGQILVMTYPLIGNYGVPMPDREKLLEPYESEKIQALGLVVHRYHARYSHHDARLTLGRWLEEAGVPAMEGVDTRALTRRLREHGTMRGKLVLDSNRNSRNPGDVRRVEMNRAVADVSCRSVVSYGEGSRKVALVDCGAKLNILRSLLKRGVSVVRVPWDYDLASIQDQVDGYVLSNGPGDPKDCEPLIRNVRALLACKKPIFGICLGHQILALAAGADTYKLPYGHRSQNQPVMDLLTRKAKVTSQNHGYAVNASTLPIGWEPWFVNLNDETNEGVRCFNGPFSSVQFHPEASPGPVDTGYLFDDFVRQLSSVR